MGALLKYIILGLLIYLVLRWLWGKRQEPGRSAPPNEKNSRTRPYKEGDIVEAKFTELPPEDETKAPRQ
jgi:lipopolysaccharide export system protein LptC